MTTTFELGSVERGDARFSTVPVAEAIRRASASTVSEVLTDDAGELGVGDLVTRYSPSARCEATSEVPGGVHAMQMHAFVGAAQLAFDQHLPLVLSPDHLWVLLSQGAAQHVYLHAETLRERFVSHAGRETIRVRRDDFVRGASDNPWPEMVEEFSEKLGAQLGKKQDLFVADFSTTGALERTVSQVVLMSAMSKYFEYAFASACGIPQITLQGTAEDWRNVRERARVFRELELGWWIDALEPILDAFVDAAEGRVDQAHWCSMYKLKSSSGGPYVSGWIQVLFPYLSCADLGRLERNPGLGTWREGMHAPFGGGPKTNDFPAPMSSAPFEWRYLTGTYPMELLAGFVGVRQASDGSVTPQLGWGVRARDVNQD